MLERRDHALQHVAVELGLDALELHVGFLAGVGRGLAHDALQALHLAAERHHQRGHQALLDLGVHAALLQQQRVGLAQLVVHGRAQRGQVAHRLRQGARELLHARVAVHLERVELGALVVLVELLVEAARGDLRLGLDVHRAQVVAHARQGGLHFVELELQRVVVLLQARAVDRDLAGIVEHLVELLDRHARGFALARAQAVAARVGPPEQARVPGALRRGRPRRSRGLRGARPGRRCGHGARSGPGGRGRFRCRLAVVLHFRLGRGARRHLRGRRFPGQGGRAAAHQAVLHLLQLLQVAVQRRQRLGGKRPASLGDLLDARLHVVRNRAHRHDAGHARTALERVQRALDFAQRVLVRGVGLPGGQRGLDDLEQLAGLGGEDLHQFGIAGGSG